MTRCVYIRNKKNWKCGNSNFQLEVSESKTHSSENKSYINLYIYELQITNVEEMKTLNWKHSPCLLSLWLSSDRVANCRITTDSRALVGDGHVTDDEARRRREIEARSDLQILPRHGLLLLRRLAVRRWQVRTRSRASVINSPSFCRIVSPNRFWIRRN